MKLPVLKMRYLRAVIVVLLETISCRGFPLGIFYSLWSEKYLKCNKQDAQQGETNAKQQRQYRYESRSG